VDRDYTYTRSVAVQAGGDDVQPGGIAHVTVDGATETLPTWSPYPQFVVGYTLVRLRRTRRSTGSRFRRKGGAIIVRGRGTGTILNG
jgi:hypothetical protein